MFSFCLYVCIHACMYDLNQINSMILTDLTFPTTSMKKVANIRFNVAKGLKTVAPVCGNAAIDSQIRPVLSLLAEDPDRDVRYFANKTLESLE